MYLLAANTWHPTNFIIVNTDNSIVYTRKIGKMNYFYYNFQSIESVENILLSLGIKRTNINNIYYPFLNFFRNRNFFISVKMPYLSNDIVIVFLDDKSKSKKNESPYSIQVSMINIRNHVHYEIINENIELKDRKKLSDFTKIEIKQIIINIIRKYREKIKDYLINGYYFLSAKEKYIYSENSDNIKSLGLNISILHINLYQGYDWSPLVYVEGKDRYELYYKEALNRKIEIVLVFNQQKELTATILISKKIFDKIVKKYNYKDLCDVVHVFKSHRLGKTGIIIARNKGMYSCIDGLIKSNFYRIVILNLNKNDEQYDPVFYCFRGVQYLLTRCHIIETPLVPVEKDKFLHIFKINKKFEMIETFISHENAAGNIREDIIKKYKEVYPVRINKGMTVYNMLTLSEQKLNLIYILHIIDKKMKKNNIFYDSEEPQNKDACLVNIKKSIHDELKKYRLSDNYGYDVFSISSEEYLYSIKYDVINNLGIVYIVENNNSNTLSINMIVCEECEAMQLWELIKQKKEVRLEYESVYSRNISTTCYLNGQIGIKTKIYFIKRFVYSK